MRWKEQAAFSLLLGLYLLWSGWVRLVHTYTRGRWFGYVEPVCVLATGAIFLGIAVDAYRRRAATLFPRSPFRGSRWDAVPWAGFAAASAFAVLRAVRSGHFTWDFFVEIYLLAFCARGAYFIWRDASGQPQTALRRPFLASPLVSLMVFLALPVLVAMAVYLAPSADTLHDRWTEVRVFGASRSLLRSFAIELAPTVGLWAAVLLLIVTLLRAISRARTIAKDHIGTEPL